MFDRLKYKNLKEKYEYAITYILNRQYEFAYDELMKFDEYSKKLLFKMHSKGFDKSPLTFDQWKDIENMSINTSTLLAYLHTFMASEYDKKCEQFKEKNTYLAYSYAGSALFAINDSYKYKQSIITEQQLIEEPSYCHSTPKYKPQVIELQKFYEQFTTYTVKKAFTERQIDLGKKYREEQQADQTYQKDFDTSSSNYDTEQDKVKEKFYEILKEGNQVLYMLPDKALIKFKDAYEYAEDNDLDDEKETARSKVVDCYVILIKQIFGKTAFSGSEMIKVEYCEDIDKMCEEALEWTHSCDEEEILKLKREAEYEADMAYKRYNNII